MRLSLYTLALLAVAAATACTSDIGVTCPPGQLTCNNQCVSIAEDAKNCGGCHTDYRLKKG